MAERNESAEMGVRGIRLDRDQVIPAVLFIVTLAAHLLTAASYPMYRDEFYYLDCANHLDWGYVDHPPLSVALLDWWRAWFGDSLLAVRFLPSLWAALLVLLTWKLTTELGGNMYARLLACSAIIFSPLLRSFSGVYSPNPLDWCFWAGLLWIITRIIKTDNRTLWLLAGTVAGFALMNRLSLLYLSAALVAGMWMTPLRKHFSSWQLWVGAGITLLLISPYVLWQFDHHWATVEFFQNQPRFRATGFAPLGFLISLALGNNVMTSPIWIGGIISLLFWMKLRSYQALGWMTAAVLATLIALHGKPYYAVGLFPLLLAAGSVYIESSLRFSLRWVLFGFVVVSGIILLPFGLRLLPPEDFLRYQAKVLMAMTGAAENAATQMPQLYSDSFGWKELTDATARVYASLPADQRTNCVIYCSNYGESGAINYYGRATRLPKAFCTHNSCFYWGPPEVSDSTVYICMGKGPDERFKESRIVAVHDHPYAVPKERKVELRMAKEPVLPMAELWQRDKIFR